MGRQGYLETSIVQVLDDALISEIQLEKQFPLVSAQETPIVSALINETKLEKQLPLVSDAEISIAQTIGDAVLSEIKLEENGPVIATSISQVNSTAINSQTDFDMVMRSLETTRKRMAEVRSGCKASFERCLSVMSAIKTQTVNAPIRTIKGHLPVVSVTSALNSKVKLEEQLSVVARVKTPVQITDVPLRETTLQERLSIFLKSLPPPSQLPRFTAAEIKASAVRFEQAISSLVALQNRIAEAKASIKETFAGLEVTSDGRIRAASVVRHSAPQSLVSLRHSIFTNSDSDEPDYESNDEDCSTILGLDYYDSEPESEHSDMEGDKPFPPFESKKARIMREKREALAATLTDDMLFNLLLVDCTTKPRLPDNAPIIIRQKISKVPIDWEPRYIGKYKVQWW
ncbi:hypothetical protein EV426DRAFT_686620 [Tirmania nivea]|nr:hypothetical protein EV426DRAFT_686620 [Tirmania nivea]